MTQANPSGAHSAPDVPLPAENALRDPRHDLGAALFFAAWPIAGWYAIWDNTYLWSDFGSDPGPSLMPTIVLTLLSVGSFVMLVRAVLLLRATRGPRHPSALFTRLLTPLLFVASLVALVPLMQTIGFLASGALFAAGWMLALHDRARGHGLLRHVAEVALATAIGVGLIFYIFVRVIHVPLP